MRNTTSSPERENINVQSLISNRKSTSEIKNSERENLKKEKESMGLGKSFWMKLDHNPVYPVR